MLRLGLKYLLFYRVFSNKKGKNHPIIHIEIGGRESLLRVPTLYSGIAAVDLLFREARAPEKPLLIQFSTLVFENNFLKTEFCGDIFHQAFGIVMETPFAVTAADAFMHYLEKDVVTQFSNRLLLYKRFVDDILFCLEGSQITLTLRGPLTLLLLSEVQQCNK